MAGADAAQKVFDAKRDNLRTQFLALLDGKASVEMTDKMRASIKTNYAAVLGLQAKYRVEALQDDAFRAKLEKLGNDYTNLIKAQ